MAIFDSKKEAVFLAALTGLSLVGLYRAATYDKTKITPAIEQVKHDTIYIHDTIAIHSEVNCIEIVKFPRLIDSPISQYEIEHWE